MARNLRSLHENRNDRVLYYTEYTGSPLFLSPFFFFPSHSPLNYNDTPFIHFPEQALVGLEESAVCSRIVQVSSSIIAFMKGETRGGVRQMHTSGKGDRHGDETDRRHTERVWLDVVSRT